MRALILSNTIVHINIKFATALKQFVTRLVAAMFDYHYYITSHCTPHSAAAKIGCQSKPEGGGALLYMKGVGNFYMIDDPPS